jgi:2-polyprenyl-3-methyl-5-hydroxy-6-metoxy-1,4-benzoquinol methylase
VSAFRDDASTPSCLDTILAPLSVREVLDVGCGSGSFTRTLAEKLGGWRSIVGIDPDKDSIDEARRLTDDRRIRYRVLAAGDDSFGAGRFDLVTISNAIHHLDDPGSVFGALRRAARPGGHLVVAELVREGLRPAERNARDVHHLKARIDRLNGRSHRETYTRAEIRSLVEAAGAAIEGECEITDPAPGAGGSEQAREAIGFLAEYLEFAADAPDYPVLQAEAQRLAAALSADGIAAPPRLLIRARFPRDPRRS